MKGKSASTSFRYSSPPTARSASSATTGAASARTSSSAAWRASPSAIGPAATSASAAWVIGVDELRLRCVMTSYDPDTQVQDKSITHGIYRRFEGRLALDCFVIVAGEIAVGDEVALSAPALLPR